MEVDPEVSVERPLRVVHVCARRTEERHDAVAGELGDPALRIELPLVAVLPTSFDGDGRCGVLVSGRA